MTVKLFYSSRSSDVSMSCQKRTRTQVSSSKTWPTYFITYVYCMYLIIVEIQNCHVFVWQEHSLRSIVATTSSVYNCRNVRRNVKGVAEYTSNFDCQTLTIKITVCKVIFNRVVNRSAAPIGALVSATNLQPLTTFMMTFTSDSQRDIRAASFMN